MIFCKAQIFFVIYAKYFLKCTDRLYGTASPHADAVLGPYTKAVQLVGVQAWPHQHHCSIWTSPLLYMKIFLSPAVQYERQLLFGYFNYIAYQLTFSYATIIHALC